MNNQGIALLITMLLLGTIIATALGVAILTAGQTGITRLVNDSVTAVFAADAGMEKVLYVCNGRSFASYPPADFTNLDIGNGAGYRAYLVDSNGQISSDCNNVLVESKGSSGSVQRSFQSGY